MGFRAHLRFSACKVGHQPAEHGCNLDLYGWSAPLCKGTGQCAIGHFLVSREMPHHTECTPIEAEMWSFKGLIRKLSNVFRGAAKGEELTCSPAGVSIWTIKIGTGHTGPVAVHCDGSNKIILWLAGESSCVQDEMGQKNETFSGVYFGCLFTATKSASITLRTP